MPKFGTKNALFGYFWDITLKNYCHIWNHHPQVCLFAKFHEETIIPKFATKNAWFMYFWAGKGKEYCHIWNQHPQICLITKFCVKTKIPKFGTKNALFGYFWDRTLKNYCHIWNQHPQKIVENESLTHTVNFGIGSAFSEGLGSAFSEGPGRGPALPYKVCRCTLLLSTFRIGAFGSKANSTPRFSFSSCSFFSPSSLHMSDKFSLPELLDW